MKGKTPKEMGIELYKNIGAFELLYFAKIHFLLKKKLFLQKK